MTIFLGLIKGRDPNPTHGAPPILELGTIYIIYHSNLHSQSGVLGSQWQR